MYFCRMFKKLSIILLVALSSSIFAQDRTRVYEFLNITTSARQAALGGNAQTSWDADPNSALWNPSLMNREMHGQFAFNYVN